MGEPARDAQWRELAREHGPLLVVVVVYVLIGLAVQEHFGRLSMLSLVFSHGALNMVTVICGLGFLLGHAIWLMPQVPPEERALTWVGGVWRQRFVTPRRLLGFAIMLVAVPVFSSTWGGLKLLIPKVQPFCWDARFYALDKALHLGHDPWRLLQPVLGSVQGTLAVNAAYNAWFLLMLAVIAWQAGSAKRDVRFRFFMTFFLLWAFPGTVLATYFSSAGPCYYDAVVAGPSPYLEQMAFLHEVDRAHGLMAVTMQRVLWEVYTTDGVQVASGISAMPSMHVSIATLLCLVGFARSRWIGCALGLFALAIQVGSVHLGWHYAIDGYAGALLAGGTWWAVGWGMRRWSWIPSDLPRGPVAKEPETETETETEPETETEAEAEPETETETETEAESEATKP